MVVLEGGGMLSTPGNQYLQPDYLSPLPTTLDAKKSPLALLAQTCSQIGADSPPSKPLISPLEKPKKESTRPPSAKAEKQRTTPTEPKLAFKPYESTVVAKKEESPKPATPKAPESPERKSASPAPEAVKSPEAKSPAPVIRSGLELLQPKEAAYKPPALGVSPLLCCPPLEPPNPAFRPPLPLPYPPYVSYARVKTPTGGEALVPVCKDPYCAGCQFGGQLLACPGGCSQCDHQKYGLAMAMLAPPPAYPLGRPYVCNWVAGEAYCGKRFVSSEELLQHLRTHTSGAEPPLFRYPNPPLSPLSAARYHPYGKPFAASPYSAFNPALGAYYQYYGQRLGAAVHP